MKFAERERPRHENAAPNHRGDPGQPDFDLQDRAAVGHRRRRFLLNSWQLRRSLHPTRFIASARNPTNRHALQFTTAHLALGSAIDLTGSPMSTPFLLKRHDPPMSGQSLGGQQGFLVSYPTRRIIPSFIIHSHFCRKWSTADKNRRRSSAGSMFHKTVASRKIRKTRILANRSLFRKI